MTRVLGAEWAARNVRANAVAPGYTDTEILNQVGAKDPEIMERLLRRIPARRFVQPDEIASLVVFLASDDASAVTGHLLIATKATPLCSKGTPTPPRSQQIAHATLAARRPPSSSARGRACAITTSGSVRRSGRAEHRRDTFASPWSSQNAPRAVAVCSSPRGRTRPGSFDTWVNASG
jgi:hypothetical protein